MTIALRRSLLLLLPLALASCKQDNEVASIYNGFPVEVGEILRRDCATPGCHDASSFAAEGRFSANSWEELFQGSSAGAVVIPYRSDQSFLLYFSNVDSSLGPVQEPLMPLNGDAISREDYLKLRDWIDAGAPSIHGDIMFEGVSEKVYVLNQGCDLLGVMDAKTRLLMRYVDVGMVPGLVESPHMMKISPDGQRMYMIFLANNPNIEVYSTKDESLIKRIPITDGDWNTINLSPDGKYAFCVAYAARKVAAANLETDEVEVFTFSKNTHGAAISPAFNRLYVTQQDESAVYRLDFTDPLSPDGVEEMDLVQGVPPLSGGYLKPHEIAYTPDGGKLLVTCQNVGEVRIYDAATEALQTVIQVGDDPVEFAFSPEHHLAFVTCMNDFSTWAPDADKVGSVAVIDYLTNTLVKNIYPGYQPHGITVDAARRLVFVANRNTNPDGPAPHHSSACGGRNGYLTAIDLTTLNLLPWKSEMSVDPYGVMMKH